MDPLLAKASAHVDFTIFIAEWLRDYHAARWFDVSRPPRRHLQWCGFRGLPPHRPAAMEAR
ncbi:MAG: hypothetical protein WDN28_28240 [Chthoniobacter sp.]